MARILALTSRVPYPPREGHQLRSFHLLRELAAVHQVHLLTCKRRDDALEDTAPLRDMLAGFETFEIPAEHSRVAFARALIGSMLSSTPFIVGKYTLPALRARLKEIVADFDLVHIDMLPLMVYADLVPRRIPLILNAHNVEHVLLGARIRVETRPAVRAFLRHQLSLLRDFEWNACKRAEAVLACSRADARQLEELAPTASVHVVANGVDLESNQPSPGPPRQPTQLVFVGQMGWFPNRDGVEWFLAEVMPRILATRPDARFVSVGKSNGLVVPDRLASSVQLAGFVPDVRQAVLVAAAYVVPLRAGSGTRLKVLEAMALGKAIVTTTIGAEGIALEPGRDALFADDAESFANAVLHLLENPDEITRLGVAARRVAEQSYGWDAIARAMLPVYSSLLA